jgi:hypothetical protein
MLDEGYREIGQVNAGFALKVGFFSDLLGKWRVCLRIDD